MCRGYKYCIAPNNCTTSNTIFSNMVLYIFGDGSMITAITGGGLDEETGLATSLTLHVRFDTNGYKKPNTYGQDIFSFRLNINDKFHWDIFSFRLNINDKFHCMTCDDHKSLTGGGVSMTDKRDKLVSACKTDPQTCGCLLMYDGWEFKRDYPW